jgi:hypothetical protein
LEALKIPLDMISSTEMRHQRITIQRKHGKAPISAFSSTLMEKPKRGRSTIPDNFLLGGRNQWASLLEESWPEIGWPLLQIRERPTSTIDDVHKAFQPVKEKPHNSGLANAFYRETVEIATPAEVHKNRKRVGELQAEVHHAGARLNDIERSIRDVEEALKIAPVEDRNAVHEEITQRQQALLQLQGEINRLTIERDALDKKSLAQEAYVYASELLDFLQSGRRAVNPKNVANALAGLPMIRWRQSHLRCSRMPLDQPRPHYSVLEVILKMWKRRRGESKASLIEFFKAQLPKLPKKLGYTRDFLLENWRDLRLAFEECLTREHEDGEAPYVLTSVFMRNTRNQKNPLERMLTEQEKLNA